MTVKEVVDASIEFLRVLTAWPLILFAALLLFRTELRRLLPELASRLGRRITRASIGGSSFEFSQEERDALRETIEQKASDLSGQPQELARFVADQVSKAVFPHHGERRTHPLEGRSILWVDDNPDNNVYESNLLKRLGAKVELSTSTAEAKQILARQAFDCVITDISRTEGGKVNARAGYELIAWLELRETEPYVPSVIYTSRLSRVDRIAAAPASGIADDPHALRDVVLDLMANR